MRRNSRWVFPFSLFVTGDQRQPPGVQVKGTEREIGTSIFREGTVNWAIFMMIKSNLCIAQPRGVSSGPDYYFTIGSPEVFERQLKEAQEVLGIDIADYLHVTYEETFDFG